jgi:uncharacterized membrane protein
MAGGAVIVWQWLRRSFIAGLFVTVPLVVSVVAIVWVFRFADRLTAGLGERLIGVEVPGLGLLTTALIVLATGALATTMIGKRFLDRTETLLMHVPLFKTIYAPVRQLMSAFSPENEFGFKRMVLVEDTSRGLLLGFLTKEFTIDRGRGPETLIAVYVPTNHLYLGDVIVCPIERAVFPEMTVEEGLGVFLTGGVGLPDHVRADKTL